MWVSEPGRVCDELYMMGEPQNCIYLLKGEIYMIIGGGMSCIAPSLEKQFAVMDFEPDRIMYLVILHSHFDHCGAVPYFKRKFPHVQVVASAYASEVFSKEKVIDYIASANQRMIDQLGLQDEQKRLDLDFDGIKVDRVVSEGDSIDLGGGIEVRFLETPGHTRCSIAAYVPKLKALFPSDATPFPVGNGRDISFPSPQYDFGLYRESQKKMAAYDVALCAFEHYGAFVDEQAKEVLVRGTKKVEWFREWVVRKNNEIGDLDKLAKLLASEMEKLYGFEFLGRDTRLVLARLVVNKVLSYQQPAV